MFKLRSGWQGARHVKVRRRELQAEGVWSVKGQWSGNGCVFEELKECSMLAGSGLQGVKPERRAGRGW